MINMATCKITLLFVFILLSFRPTGALGTSYPQGSTVRFKTVTAPEDVEFARKYLARYFEGEKPVAWDRAIRGRQIKIARADLDEDGVPEVFILVETSIWCGSRGVKAFFCRIGAGNGGLWTGQFFLKRLR
jgi:hypothetical protein